MMTLKSLVKNDEVVVPTFSKVFKFDISCANIQQMLSSMIDKIKGEQK